MTFRSIARCLAVAAAAATSLAHGAPQATTQQPNRVRLAIVEAAGSVSTPQGDYSFTVKSYTEVDGSRAGSVFVDGFSAFYQFITCTGPEFANAVTMKQSTGAVTVNAAIDLSNPNCFAVNYSAGPLTLNFSGQPDGNERTSESVAGKQQLFGETFKYNSQSDAFSEVFTGTSGLYTGQFTGRATSSRSVNRSKLN